ncbi:MAG: epoxyqueuosine reductase [Deltaproteobacteria bacterium]|nr:epoxyqueuosine reductase [Deltaproteobacteria bacterium]MBW2360687.1 epoxyqueuosine reductase [Deltaproteobacteria bacterium]
MAIEKRIDELLTQNGAVAVGFATRETLSGGPPSADLEHVLPGARSAVSFALAFDRDKIRAYLSKRDSQAHNSEQQTLYTDLYLLSEKVAALLRENGHDATAIIPNGEYRMDRPSPGYLWDSHPPLSHRYMAVASGVAAFGWSGLVGIKGYGANILLGTCVTTAELAPTEPIPVDESYCDECKVCVEACPSEMFEKEASMTQSLGGVTYEHSARKSITRCLMCCSGLTGLHKSGKWGSWSPGRFSIPDDEERLREEVLRAASLSKQRPDAPLETGDAVTFPPDHPFSGIQMVATCGNCQLVCFGDKRETTKNLKLLRKSGCVVQQPDGSLEVLPPADAAGAFAEMDPAHRQKYE